jgi:hypothetical protein
MGSDTNYWRDVLPAVLVLALGMAGAVAPLTTAVLGSVDARHTVPPAVSTARRRVPAE